MSSRFKRNSDLAFGILHRALDAGDATLYQTATAWTLPVGVSYDKNVDRFVVSASRTVIAPDLDTWQIERLAVPLVPNRRKHTMGVQGPLLMQTETLDAVFLQWQQATEDFLAAGIWRVGVANRLYKLKSYTLHPIAVSEPSLIELFLES